MLQEFKKFAMRGNVIDLAVGVIIGAAFGKIVSSFVGDIVMPPLGVLVGGVNFSDLAVTLQAAVGDKPAVLLAYGKFIQTIFDFLIIIALKNKITIFNDCNRTKANETDFWIGFVKSDFDSTGFVLAHFLDLSAKFKSVL